MSTQLDDRRPDATTIFDGETNLDRLVEAGEVEMASARVAFRCRSGRTIAGRWRGVPVAELLDRAEAPDSTTHLAVESATGHRACVRVTDALDGMLAVQAWRNGTRSDGDELPRLVGSGIDGPRTMKRVSRIAAIRLEPGEDAMEYERLPE